MISRASKKQPAKAAANTPEGGSTLADWAVAGLCIATAGLAAFRVYKAMKCPVQPDMVAVVYNARRMNLFSTSIDSEKQMIDARMRGDFRNRGTIGTLKTLLHGMCFPTSYDHVTRPPLPWYKVFILPRTILSATDNSPILQAKLTATTSDGGTVVFHIKIQYYIDCKDISRYLTLVGALGAKDALSRTLQYCVDAHARKIGAVVLTNGGRRAKHFTPNFTAHLQSKIYADSGVRLVQVDILDVELTQS